MATSESSGARQRASATNVGEAIPMRPFRTHGDTFCIHGQVDEAAEPTLLFNPKASQELLIASLHGRVSIMRQWLLSLELVEADTEMNHFSNYGNLAVLAEELTLFVEELGRKERARGEVQP